MICDDAIFFFKLGTELGENTNWRKVHLQEAHPPQPAHGAPVFHRDPMRERKKEDKWEKKRRGRKNKHN